MAVRHQFPGLALGWAVIFTGLAAHAAPPPEQDTAQWSDANRQIAAESGARITGQWKTSVAPYGRRPMICAGVDHPAPSVWLRWSAKTSKTQIFLNAAFHCIDTAPRSIMVVCATDQKQKDFEREVFSPASRATPKIALKIMPVRSRSGDGSTTYHKKFRGGFLKIVNGGSEPQLQQSDIGLLIFEEPSSYEADVGGRGSPIAQARTRTLAWGDDAKEIGGGTPGFVGDCVVTEQVEAGTCERFYVPCPQCGARQVLAPENLKKEQRPYFLCLAPDCGGIIGHEDKRWMLDEAGSETLPMSNGDLNFGWFPCFESADPANPPPPAWFPPEEAPKWAARDMEGRAPSFDAIWQAYSPFTTWTRIVTEHAQASASGDPEKLVTYVQQVEGRPFETVHERPATSSLFDTREAAAALAGVVRGRIPTWAFSIYLTVDVQGDRLEWIVLASGKGGRRARIDRGVISIPPVDPRAWSELSQIASRVYEGPCCKPLGFDRVGVDTGGHHTNQAYMWCAGRPNTMALKGKPNDRSALPLTQGSMVKARVGGRVVAGLPLYLVGTHKLKKDVYFGLAQTLQGVEMGAHLPGSITLEADSSAVDFQQLTAEVLLAADPAKGRREEAWERSPRSAPNEQLDLTVYGLALEYSFVRTDGEWDALIANRWRDPVELTALPLETLWLTKADTLPRADGDASSTRTVMPPPAAVAAVPGPNRAAAALLKLARQSRGDEEDSDA